MQREQGVEGLRGEQNRTCAGSGQPSQVGLVLWGAGGTQDSFSGASLHLHVRQATQPGSLWKRQI